MNSAWNQWGGSCGHTPGPYAALRLVPENEGQVCHLRSFLSRWKRCFVLKQFLQWQQSGNPGKGWFHLVWLTRNWQGQGVFFMGKHNCENGLFQVPLLPGKIGPGHIGGERLPIVYGEYRLFLSRYKPRLSRSIVRKQPQGIEPTAGWSRKPGFLSGCGASAI